MRWRRLSAAAASAVAALVAAELSFRLLAPRLGVNEHKLRAFQRYLEQGYKKFEPYPYVNFVIRSRAARSPTLPRDWAFEEEAPPGVRRIACLGGSTTRGGYPRFLQGILRDRLSDQTARPVQVMNWGVPGWTSLETMVNYFANVQDYAPDVVVILHALNDTSARRAPGYRTDYAHWRQPWAEPDLGAAERFLALKSDLVAHALLRRLDGLALSRFVVRPAAPDPTGFDPLHDGSERGFERNLRTIAEHVVLRGGRVVLVTMPSSRERAFREDGTPELWQALLTQHNEITRRIAAQGDHLLVDVERIAGEHLEEHFVDHIHLDPGGLFWQARQIARAILDAGYLD